MEFAYYTSAYKELYLQSDKRRAGCLVIILPFFWARCYCLLSSIIYETVGLSFRSQTILSSVTEIT